MELFRTCAAGLRRRLLVAEGDPYSVLRAIVIATGLAAAAVIFQDLIFQLQRNPSYISADFIVFWVTARAPDPYDFDAITAAQHWYTSNPTIRPFAYPPSFLPWIAPSRLLPLLPAYFIWTVSTATLFYVVWSRIVERRHIWIALLAPTTLVALIPGQVVFLLGALIVAALASLKSRPVLAGILLGLAATIKPQAVILIPVAFAAGRHWRALLSAACTGAAIGVVCVALQGTSVWLEWLKSMPRFMAIIRETRLIEFGITPTSSLIVAGVPEPAATVIKACAALLGLATVWSLFRRTDDVALRVLALNASTLLVAPYGMAYELALAAPAAVKVLLDRKVHPVATFAAAMILTSAGEWLSMLMMCGVLLHASLKPHPNGLLEAAREASDEPAVLKAA